MTNQRRQTLQKEIDGSPFWNIDVSTRKALFKGLQEQYAALKSGETPAKSVFVSAGIENLYRTIWAECMELKPDADPTAVTLAFFKAAGAYQRKSDAPQDSFCAYFSAALAHEEERVRREDFETTEVIGRETARKLKKAEEYMANFGYTLPMLLKDSELESAIAKDFHLSVKTLREGLQNRQNLLSSLDDTVGGDGDGRQLSDTVAAPNADVETQVENSLNEELFPRLQSFLNLMNLKQKGKYAAKMGPFWSSTLLRYLRQNEEPAQDKEKLIRCDDLRPLEEEGLLWDQLLLRPYVRFVIEDSAAHPLYSGEGPENPKELECAALNPLNDPSVLPGQDKTVAKFLGLDKSTVSTRRRQWMDGLKTLLG